MDMIRENEAELLGRMAASTAARLGDSLASIPDPTVAALLTALPSLAADVARTAARSFEQETVSIQE